LLLLSECRVSGLSSRTRRYGTRTFVAGRASPLDNEAGCSMSDICAVTPVDRSRRSSRHEATNGDAHANIVATSFTRTRPKPDCECTLSTSKSAEANVSTPRPPFQSFTAEAVNPLPGAFGTPLHPPPPKWIRAHRPPDGCLPPTNHRSGPLAQDTQRESDDVSHGVRFLSTFEPRRSLCWFS
jgi:hypothetical protein